MKNLVKESRTMNIHLPQVIGVDDYHEFSFVKKVLDRLAAPIVVTMEELDLEDHKLYGTSILPDVLYYALVYIGKRPSEEMIEDRLNHPKHI